MRAVLTLALFVGFANFAHGQPVADRKLQQAAVREKQLLEAVRGEFADRGGRSTLERLERVIFPPDGDPEGTRQDMDMLLAAQLREIQEIIELSEEQKKKLYLAGRGDIKRAFRRLDDLKRQIQSEPFEEERFKIIRRNIGSVRMCFRDNLFHDQSLFHKCLYETLNEGQLSRYEKFVLERRASKHQTDVKAAVEILNTYVPMDATQRLVLHLLLTNEIPVSALPNAYGVYRVLNLVNEVPDEKLRRALTDAQCRQLRIRMDQFRSAEVRLVAVGLLPEEPDVAVQVGGK